MTNEKDICLPKKKWFTIPSAPKCRFYEIIYAFKDDGVIFTAKDVSMLFDITVADARRRMIDLTKWNLVKIVSHSKIPKTCNVYRVSRWGKQYLINQGHKLNLPAPPTTATTTSQR
jgi:hypothetical protein